MAPAAEGSARQSASIRAENSSRGMRSDSQSEGPTSSVEFIASTRPSTRSDRDLDQRGSALGQSFGAARGQQHRLAAQEITGLRQMLVRMDHEHHALRQHGIVVDADVAGTDRAEAQSMAAPADVR